MEAFSNAVCDIGEANAPKLLEEFLELIEQEAASKSERMLEQAAISDRLRAIASRRR